MTTWSGLLLLGCGSGQPGIRTFDPSDGGLQRILSLRRGDSVYSIARSPLGGLLAVGTRGGNLFLLDRNAVEASMEGQEGVPAPAAHYSPILSLCFADEHHVVVATAEQTFWITTTAPNTTYRLETHGHVICALTAVSKTKIFGLSPRGQVLAWAIPSGECFSQQEASPPPGDVLGVVTLLHWSCASALAYGASNGDLVLRRIDGKKHEVRAAHAGELYALACNERYLLTAGRTDGQLKLWVPDSSQPVCQFRHQCEATSTTFVMDEQPRFALIDANGRASIFEADLASGMLCHISEIPETHYRAVVGPDLVQQRQERLAGQAARMREIWTTTIPSLLAHPHGGQDLALCCSELETNGYLHFATWLRAEIAARQGIVLEELGHRYRLHQMYNAQDKWFLGVTEQYADLLMSLWQLGAACEVFSLLPVTPERPDLAHKRHAAERLYEQMATCIAIADPGDRVDALVNASMMLGKPFTGRWVINRLAERKFDDIVVTSSELFTTYLAQLQGRLSGIAARAEEVLCLSTSTASQVSALVFTDKDSRDTVELQFLLLAEIQGKTVRLTPAIVLSADGALALGGAEEHNRRVMALLQEAASGEWRECWVGQIVQATGAVMRDVVTALHKQRKQLMGVVSR